MCLLPMLDISYWVIIDFLHLIPGNSCKAIIMTFWFLPSHNLALFSRIITRRSIKASLGNYFGEHRVFSPIIAVYLLLCQWLLLLSLYWTFLLSHRWLFAEVSLGFFADALLGICLVIAVFCWVIVAFYWVITGHFRILRNLSLSMTYIFMLSTYGYFYIV